MSFYYTKKDSLVGLDIQAEEVSLIHMKRKRGVPSIESIAAIKLSAGMIVDGKIVAYDEVLSVLKLLARQTNTVGHYVACALPGFCVISKCIELPNMLNEDEWEADIAAHLDTYLPGITDEILFDYYPVDGASKATQVMLIAAKKELVNQYINLIHQAGLIVRVVDVDYNALARAFVHNATDKDKPVVLLDVGVTIAHILILQNANVLLVKQINVTGFTADFLRELTWQIQQAIQSCHSAYCKKIFLSGKSSQLKNIQRYLTKSLALSVELIISTFNHSESLPKEKMTELILRSMISVGLGLHGGRHDRN